MKSQYLEEFKNTQDVEDRYEQPGALEGCKVLLAWYGYGDYCGQSLVIFSKKRKLYEVNGSHCSCYGLEGQWIPELTTWESLKMRDFSHYEGGAAANAALQALVSKHLKS